MLQRIGALGIALALVAVPMMTAQNKPAKQPQRAVQAPRVSHAIIGTIKQVDAQTNTIVVTPISGADQVFRFGAKTVVRGLPRSTKVSALRSKIGEKIVLHYAVAEEKAEALSIEYLGTAEIQQFAGTVVSVDTKAHTLTLKPATGVAEAFVIAPRATLDLKSGVVPFAQLTRFTKVQATVFYSMRGKEKVVWYLQETAVPAVSLR
jgi:hypothetical protein